MLAGEGYFASYPELTGMLARAQELLFRFNGSHPSEIKLRIKIAS